MRCDRRRAPRTVRLPGPGASLRLAALQKLPRRVAGQECDVVSGKALSLRQPRLAFDRGGPVVMAGNRVGRVVFIRHQRRRDLPSRSVGGNHRFANGFDDRPSHGGDNEAAGSQPLHCTRRNRTECAALRNQPVRRASTSRPSDDSTAGAEGSFARSAMRLVALFEALAKTEEGVSLAELSATIVAPKSSLLGILRSMVALGYMEHGHGLYRLGPKSFRLAADILAIRRFPNLVRPILQDLAAKSGETVFLVVLDHLAQRVTYADIIDSANPVRYTVPTGTTRPLYVSSGGLMIGAPLDRFEQELPELKRLLREAVTRVSGIAQALAEEKGAARD